MEDKALYIRDGDAYVGTILTQGAWDPAAAHGGAALALLGQHLDAVPSLVPMSVSRFTADLLRPAPVGRRMHVAHRVVRDGKKIQIVELALLVDDVEHARVSALRLRHADFSDLAEGPLSSTQDRPADALVGPDEAESVRPPGRQGPGVVRAVDMRRARRRDGTGSGVWIRLDAAVVAGEEVGPTARMTFAFDFANLIGMAAHPSAVTMINPDVTAHVLRPPSDDWVAITGDTRFDTRFGRGVSSAVFSDADGPYAFVSTSQILQRRQP